MSLMEEVSDRGMALPLGIGLVVAAVSVGPRLVKTGRPFIKRAIKGYLMLQERSKEMFAETSERMQDLYAEAKHEYEQESEAMKAEAERESAMQAPEEPEAAEEVKPAPRPRRTARKSEAQ